MPGVWLVRRDGVVEVVAASNTVLYQIAVVENDLGEGPCRDALWRESMVHVEDTGTDPRGRAMLLVLLPVGWVACCVSSCSLVKMRLGC